LVVTYLIDDPSTPNPAGFDGEHWTKVGTKSVTNR
jgi:hypothetical protein